MKRKLLVTVMTLALLLVFAVPAMAAITKHAVKMPDETVQVYNYQELSQSFMNYYLGNPGAELFQEYSKGTLVAIYDDVKGWVDFANIKNAYVQSVINSQQFNLNTYVTTSAIQASMPSQITEVTVSEGGQLVKTEKPLDGQSNLPAVKSFSTVPSLELGKMIVVVVLDTANPENYEVWVKDVKLTFDAASKKFAGDVSSADAVQANVVVKSIGGGDGSLEVISIE